MLSLIIYSAQLRVNYVVAREISKQTFLLILFSLVVAASYPSQNLVKCLVLDGGGGCDITKTTQQTHNICITFVQRRPNVIDVSQILYKCYTNILCLLGIVQIWCKLKR